MKTSSPRTNLMAWSRSSSLTDVPGDTSRTCCTCNLQAIPVRGTALSDFHPANQAGSFAAAGGQALVSSIVLRDLTPSEFGVIEPHTGLRSTQSAEVIGGCLWPTVAEGRQI